MRARSGAAPSCSNTASAASSSSSHPSSSPRARQASPEQHPHACGHIGRLDLLPQLEGTAQRAERGLGVAFGELDRAAGLRGHRAQHAGIEAPGDLLQLAAGAARVLEVADRQHDLDVGGQ